MKTLFVVLAFIFALVGCTSQPMTQAKAPLKDGDSTVPADYKSWPKMLTSVQRPDAKQVRDLYIAPASSKVKAGDAFPYGTVMVMENYAAKAKPDGTLETGPDGKLVRGELVRVFIMEKAKGAGQDVPQELRNGEWVYAAYLPDGKKAEDNLTLCRACHLPVTDKKDFVQRYDEYFATRGAP